MAFQALQDLNRQAIAESSPDFISNCSENGNGVVIQMKNYFLVEKENNKNESFNTSVSYGQNIIRPLDDVMNDAFFAKRSKQKLRNRYFILRHGESEANKADVISSNPNIATKIHGLTEQGKEQAKNAAPALFNILRQQKEIISHGIESFETNFEPITIKIISSDFTRAIETAEKFRDSLIRHSEQNWATTVESCDNLMSSRRKNESGLGDPAKVVIDQKIHFDLRLRERWFGSMDGGNDSKKKYEEIWKDDNLEDELSLYLQDIHKNNSIQPEITDSEFLKSNGIISPKSSFSVESVHHVRQRVCDLILEKERLEDQTRHKNVKESPTDDNNGFSDSRNKIQESYSSNYVYVFVAHGDTLQILQTAFASEVDFDARKHRSLPHLGNSEVREMKIVNLYLCNKRI